MVASKTGRALRLILGGLLLASWAYPPSREFQILCLRLLFGQTRISPTTYVQGQPPGCLVYHYPNVQLTEERKKELAADATASPDSFIAAGDFLHHDLKWPSPALWDGHPHVEWAAFRIAFHFTKLRTRADNERLPDPEQAHEFVRYAQRTHPDNGALWLAEASLYYYQGNTDSAAESVKMAINKGNWDGKSKEAYVYSIRLLQREGLPVADAASLAAHGYAHFLVSNIEIEITREMATAIYRGDRQKFLELLSLLKDFQKPVWKDKFLFRRLSKITDYLDSDLVYAMKIQMKELPPPHVRRASWAEIRRDNAATVTKFLDSWAGKGSGAEMLELRKLADEKVQHDREEASRVGHVHSRLSSAGDWAFFLLAALFTVILMNLPFAFFNKRIAEESCLPRSADLCMKAMARILSVCFKEDFRAPNRVLRLVSWFGAGFAMYIFTDFDLGNLWIILISVLVALSIAIAVILFRQPAGAASHRLRSSPFWISAFVSVCLCTLLYFGYDRGSGPSPGLYIGTEPQLTSLVGRSLGHIPPLILESFLVFGFFSCWMALKTVYHRKGHPPRLVPASLVILGYVYLATVALRIWSDAYLINLLGGNEILSI